jgi:rusticyanin
MMGGYGMGSGMMGGGASDRPVYPGWGGDVLDFTQVTAFLDRGEHSGTADPKTNTVTYTEHEVTIDIVAVQPGHDDQTFEVHGLVNPTLTVPVGATVHLTLVNMDHGSNMEHGIIVTQVPPPYPYMSMMATGPGVAWLLPLLPWRSEDNVRTARYASLDATFVARARGTYWYVCPTPGHASQGMFGKLVVQ